MSRFRAVALSQYRLAHIRAANVRWHHLWDVPDREEPSRSHTIEPRSPNPSCYDATGHSAGAFPPADGGRIDAGRFGVLTTAARTHSMRGSRRTPLSGVQEGVSWPKKASVNMSGSSARRPAT